MRLYLVRHPRPVVTGKTCYGRTDLSVLPEQERSVASALLPLLPPSTPIFSSPAQRCRGLATRLSDSLGHGEPLLDERLLEMDFGGWEMRTWDDIGQYEVDAWAADMLNHRPGGGENVLEMAQRVRAFHDEVVSLRHESVIVICHAGTIRLLAACERGLSVPEMALYAARRPHKIEYGGLLLVDC